MLGGIRSSLELRMIILAGTGLLAAFALFAGLSIWAVDEGTNRTLEERRLLARAAADRLGDLLQENLDALLAVSYTARMGATGSDVDLTRRALHDTYLRSIFRDGIYLMDVGGTVLLSEPASQAAVTPARQAYVQRAVETGKPIVSDVYRVLPTDKAVLSALIPVRDGTGEVVAVLGGDIDPTDRRIQDIVRSIAIGSTGYAQVVDSAGAVFAGRGAGQIADLHQNEYLAALVRRGQTGVGNCHECHLSDGVLQRQDEVIGFAPVPGAHWSVVVRQSEEEAFLPAHRLRQIIIFVALPLFFISVAVAWATARSVVRPIAMLAASAERIAGGDLASPVPQDGRDEIGRLARTFELMRLHLQESLRRIQGWNAELEERVRERTLQLREQENVRRELLRKVISAQEEERRRMARELHDDTSQSLAALILALETALLASVPSGPFRKRLDGLKTLATQILDGVHKLIYDLRPSLLDDLGLVAALRWYAETRLQAAGIAVSFETSGPARRLPSEVETTLFRALQEAITNVAKHSGAETAGVRLEMRPDLVEAEVEDDGQGFDPAVLTPEVGNTRGLGLLGMEERIGLLNGRMSVVSRPGQGTRLHFEVPLAVGGEHNEADSCAPRGRS